MSRVLRVLHIASGDLWAGAEVQSFILMSNLRRMPDTVVAAVLMNEGALCDRLRSVGILVHVVDEQSASPIAILSRLRDVLRSWRPDIVHTHREKENILGSLASRLWGNVPCVRTVHGANEHLEGNGWSDIRRQVVSNLDRWCGRALQQRVIAVTRDLGAQLAGEFSADKIAVIENGIDTEEVKQAIGVAEFRQAAPNATHIGIAGRLVHVKRVDLFLETAALLLRDHPHRNWKFHVFGDGPMRRELEEFSKALQISKRVTFHGHRQDILTCIAGLHGLVMCSDHEGMPMVALEATALGVPMVAHAVGGLIDVVPEEFLVAQHTAYGYKEGVLRILCSDGRTIFTKNAAETLMRFSAQRNADRVRALYVQVLAEKG